MSHATAIKRNSPSAPVRLLAEWGLFVGDVLDYGSGRGEDANYYNLWAYDPYHGPPMPEGYWDTIVCNYVLNTVPKTEVNQIVIDIRSRLKENGIAYVSVRRDLPKEGMPGRGCYQRYVVLNEPILVETKGFCIYWLKRG